MKQYVYDYLKDIGLNVYRKDGSVCVKYTYIEENITKEQIIISKEDDELTEEESNRLVRDLDVLAILVNDGEII